MSDPNIPIEIPKETEENWQEIVDILAQVFQIPAALIMRWTHRDYLMEIQAFRGSVSVCSSCKSIRDDQGHWQPIERYLIRHPEATFTHGLCPHCRKTLYSDFNEDEEDWE